MDDNSIEKILPLIKTKMKVSGEIRSDDGAKNYF